MRTITPRRIPIALLIAVALISQSCSPNKIREARKSAHRIQVVTDAAIDTTATLFHDGIIDQAKKNQIAQALLKVNTGNRVLIEKAAAATSDTPAVRADLLAQLKVIEDAVRDLKAAGILGIKSKNGTLAFESSLNALDAAIALIQAALAGGK
jgi:hypothetical protein